MPRRWKLRLTAADRLSPTVRALAFDVLGSAQFEYQPGQAIDLLVPLPSGLMSKRPYSIANAPGHSGPGRIELAVTRVPEGPTSDALHRLQPGATLQADGPRGVLVRRAEERDQASLFVAAGSGVAPLRAILQEELARGSGPPIGLLFGCRSPDHILYRDQLEWWMEQNRRFRLDVTLSQPPSGYAGRAGYVQKHIPEVVDALRPQRAYVCGLSAMVEATVKALKEVGMPPGSIRTELYDG